VAVWYRQTVDGEVTDERQIAPVDGVDDLELLEIKEASAVAHGWDVDRRSTRLIATKTRWGGDLCVREFWVE
jgi:hypothetical protein